MSSPFFSQNVGPTDRWLRIALGVALLAIAFVGPRTAWGYLGIIPLMTGAFGTCPFYSLFGLSTCPRPTRNA